MLLKKIISGAAAAVLSVTCMASAAFADAAERPEIPFKFDPTMTTTEKVPALSFDSDGWEDHISLTKDAAEVGVGFSLDKTTHYQGFSLKVTASGESSKLFFNSASIVDSDGNPVYPDAQKEDAVFICPGIELNASTFGLSCFDGCFITYAYKIGADVEQKLMDNSIYCFGTDDTYNINISASSSTSKLTYDAVVNNNVTQYSVRGNITIPVDSACTKIVFEIPVLHKLESDALCLDNITIALPEKDKDGKDLYIKNLDGYNPNAKPQEIINEIKILDKKESSIDFGEAAETKEGNKTIVIVIIAVVAVVAGGLIGFMVLRRKKKFY